MLLFLLPAALAADPPDGSPPGVLLVTLDTTRADRLGSYGYALAETPTTDRLAAEGTRFSRAYSTCPLTIPSHSTMMTGRVPPSHGVRDNGDFILGDEAITLAERFAEAGYTTAAFTSAFPTQARWGFDQGFDVYHDPLERLPTQLDWRDQRAADEVIDDALETLEGAEGPLFVWIHLFDAHWPYEPPAPYEGRHEGRPYDGEIAFADAQLGRFLEWWDTNQPRSVVAVTADHGEGLGDGGEQTHGFLLHDGTIRIPLILRGEGVEVGEVTDDPVSHIDLAPTLLEIAGLPLHEGLQGADLRRGGSEVAWSEALTGQFNLGLAPLFATTDAAGRYTEGAWGGWYPADGERVPAEPEEGADLDEVAARHHEIAGGWEHAVAPTAALDAETFAQLAALGYMGGGGSTIAPGEIDPRDVIEHIPKTWQARQLIGAGRFQAAEALLEELEAALPGTHGVALLRAQWLRAMGALPEASEIYAGLYLESPSSTVALQLAGIYAAMGDWVEAEGWFAEALELQPMSPEAMAGLVHAARSGGENERARELAESFLVIYPDHVELTLVRAELLLLDYRYSEALALAREGVARTPRSPWALTLEAQALWELGEADPAIERLQQALELDRFNLPVRLRLAECLLDVGRNAEAVRAVAPAARLLPDAEPIQELYRRAEAALDEERRR
jgi:tetratricopeptide (TPR) repeat protein